MKKSAYLTSIVAVSASFLFFSTTSCKNNADKTPDTEEVADDANEDKFNDTAKEDDSEFLVKAAEINMDEIALGELAQQKGTAQSVRDLGKMMFDEHTVALGELKTLAAGKNISLPAGPTEDGQETLKKFQDKKTADFDKDYAAKMVDGHKDAISKFEKASTDAADADVRAWAAKMLPALKMHLEHSETVKAQLK